MIINSGMRTDIPAFYSEWFINRIRAGFVYTRNPYNNSQVTKYRLSPDVVDVLAFCTKNPAPMLEYLGELKAFGQFWFVTITPYGVDIEPNVPSYDKVMQDFISLSDSVGIDSVCWRYDPILINETYTVERHICDFEKIAQTLAGHTKSCVISFIDIYKKVRINFPEVKEVSKQDRITLGREFATIGERYGVLIKACAEGTELMPYGVDCNGCMTVKDYERAIHARLDVPKKKSQRTECACLLGSDIGQYDTCGHLCRYCYANTRAEEVKKNMKLHDPKSPFLVGELQKDDVIHEAVQELWRDDQLYLFMDCLNS